MRDVKFGLMLLGLLMSLGAMAQKVNVRGALIGSDQAGLEMANILVLNPDDSSMVTYGFSNSEGQFRFQLEGNKQYLFKFFKEPCDFFLTTSTCRKSKISIRCVYICIM